MAIVMNQASVGTAATFVGYIPPAGYMAALGTSPVYLGTGSAVTVSTGFLVPVTTPLVWQNALAAPAVPVYAVASANGQALSYGFGNGPAGQVIAGGTAALQLDHNAGDIQPVGLAAGAGNSGLASDAKHAHTLPLTSPGDLLTVSGGTALARLPAGGSTQVLGVSGGAPAWVTSLSLLASTGAAGTALVNATPTMLSWTAPNDGNLHWATVFASMDVTSPETGGLVQLSWYTPDGTAGFNQLFAGGLGAGAKASTMYALAVGAGKTVSVVQSSALSGGTATLWAGIWGS